MTHGCRRGGKGGKPSTVWVACDRCEKWRRLPKCRALNPPQVTLAQTTPHTPRTPLVPYPRAPSHCLLSPTAPIESSKLKARAMDLFHSHARAKIATLLAEYKGKSPTDVHSKLLIDELMASQEWKDFMLSAAAAPSGAHSGTLMLSRQHSSTWWPTCVRCAEGHRHEEEGVLVRGRVIGVGPRLGVVQPEVDGEGGVITS